MSLFKVSAYIFLCVCPIPSIDNGNNSIEDKVQETEKLPKPLNYHNSISQAYGQYMC